MNNKNKKGGSKAAAIPGIIFLAVMMILANTDNAEMGVGIAAVLVVIAVAGFAVSAVWKGLIGKNAPKTRTPQSRPAQARMAEFERTPSARRAQSARRSEAEDAIRCAHSRGKEKYLEQLDGFLANGIIDKAEYRLMKERYSKLQIEDDYH